MLKFELKKCGCCSPEPKKCKCEKDCKCKKGCKCCGQDCKCHEKK